MGMLPSMYPQNFQILDEQQSSQYFSVGGLYDSLAAAAAIAAGQIGDPSQITNFCWPTFDYYGGGQNSSSTINWTHWGYPTIDSNVGELIQQQNHSTVESGGSLSIFDSIAPIIEGSTEIKSQINSNNNQKEWQKTAAILAATTSTTSTNNNRQLTSKFVSKRGRGRGPATSLTSTASNGNGPQHQRMESSQSRHCNNSSAINANECGGGLENVNEQQKLQTISPILLNFPPIQQLTSAAMRDYLANPGRYECAMWIFHAKVAQKSYGNEKRFFCPPPCVYLLGEGWRNRRKALDQIFKRIKEQNEKNSSDFLPNGDSCHEMFSEIISTIGINQPTKCNRKAIMPSYSPSSGLYKWKTKALFISDTDKRKYFYLHTTFSHACGGIDIGTFSSQRIKVISKPSKKKQSMKSSDCKYLCVSNGSKIALFNRLRSQTVSTRYLHVENGCFHASSTKWGAFHINSDNPQPFTTNNSNNNQTSTIITYGSVIQLIDAQSNIALPKLRIRKVDKQMVLLDPSSQGEPVSQLHKCAFQMVDTSGGGAVVAGQESLYLCLSHDKIIQHQAVRIDPNRHQISDGAAWTIISTDKSEYRWAEPLANIGSFARLPITPMPQLHNLNISSLNSETNNGIKSEIPTNIELNGSNFSPSIRVWIGATPTETIFCSSERLNCSIPFLNLICSDLGFNTETAILANSNNGNEKLDVPILLVREEDSVVFPTSLSFTYSLTGPFTTSENTKKQQQSGKDNNLLINLETSSNKINNLNRFHPYWNNSENNGDSTGVNN
uniref:Uncharacterized protein n=1 Tax=Meloidogyne enterolobii TaxID=390850 RepID=A0A6V7W8J5_MELEN|nr:unnamed protein product [Meloidogyne enterolobii]